VEGPARTGAGGRAYLWLFAMTAASGGTAALILTGHPRPAALTTVGAAVALLAGRAAARRGRHRRAIFSARVLDRVHDGSVLAPLAWVARDADVRLALAALVGLGAAFVAAYERARGASLGFRIREPAGYRALLSAVLVMGLLGDWIEEALWAFSAVAVSAAVVRARSVARQHRGAGRAGAVP
jgi:hypothetical protein